MKQSGRRAGSYIECLSRRSRTNVIMYNAFADIISRGPKRSMISDRETEEFLCHNDNTQEETDHRKEETEVRELVAKAEVPIHGNWRIGSKGRLAFQHQHQLPVHLESKQPKDEQRKSVFDVQTRACESPPKEGQPLL